LDELVTTTTPLHRFPTFFTNNQMSVNLTETFPAGLKQFT